MANKMRVVDTSEKVSAADANAKIEGLRAEGYVLMHDMCSPGRLVFLLPKSAEKEGKTK